MFDVFKKQGKEDTNLNPTQKTVDQAVNDGGITVEKSISIEDEKFNKAKGELTKRFGQRIKAFADSGCKVDVKKLVNDYMADSNGEILISDTKEVIWKVKKAADKIVTLSSPV